MELNIYIFASSLKSKFSPAVVIFKFSAVFGPQSVWLMRIFKRVLTFHTGETLDEETDISALLKRIPQNRDVTKLIETEHLNAEQTDQFLHLTSEFKDIFWLPGDKLSMTPKLTAQIDTGDHQPVSKRPYRGADNLLKPLKEEIQDLLDQDIIRPSMHSPWNSPSITLQRRKYQRND